MGPRTKHKRHTVDLLAVQAQIDNIALQISDARTAASLKGTIQNARKIKNCAQRLTKDVEKLIKAMESPMGLPSKPAKKNKSGAQSFNFQQDSLLNCCYSGAVKFGSAQMWESIVPTIHEAMSDWDAHKELGFFKVKIEENVMRNIDPAKISNSIIDALDKCQSKILRFSGMPKRHRLHGLVCDVLIEDDPSSLFEIPHLDAKGYGLDCRELFCSTVRDASRSNRKPYLVNPADSSSRWRESVGLPQEPYLDCGERLKMTSSRIPGVHTAYEYYSTGRGSGSAMHVEDGYLGSMNLVLAGAPKVWLLVQPRFREKLEAKVKEELMEDTGSYVCSQFVRHLDKLLSPELLDSWEIPYHTVPCKAGEMIVTLSETYHQVINAGTNYAVAVNFAVEPDWTGVPAGYGFCKKGCSPGVEPITAEQLRVQESDAHGPDCQADEDEVYSDDEPKEPFSNAYPTSDRNNSKCYDGIPNAESGMASSPTNAR
ncbi:JmjC domain, hydroxylase-domain-containing protein [Macrophomina phaseolina]|uniref:JmjC domain, hydroxylase-domain-containing protein n=1 Tax=Macrophomina phaseolina TaxID=35725 RepID=A0ABQ8GFH2_9PEZI|nr:JmjC domain, hydroxylase-domain-containing protein [Macrophomina phaseolina]